MQNTKKVMVLISFLGVTLNAGAMKRSAEDAELFGGNPFERYNVGQGVAVSKFSFSDTAEQLKLKLTKDILENWPLNTPEKVIAAINYLLREGSSLNNSIIEDILSEAQVQVDSTEEWCVAIDRDVIQMKSCACADILMALYARQQKIFPLILLGL